jgi:hypothetical protein
LTNHAFKSLTGAETRWPSSVPETEEKVLYLNNLIDFIEGEDNDLLKI